MPAPFYSRETIDARFDALRHELLAAIANLRTDLKGEIGDLKADMNALEGRLSSQLASLRGEWKVWMLVMGAVLAVLSSGVGNRLLNLVWPTGPAGPAGPAAMQQR